MILLLEIIGTIAFAVSGAQVAFKKEMDILGVIVLGVTTATGGGILRDLFLGITPPAAFTDPIYIVLSAAVSLIVFIPPVRKKLGKIDGALLVADAIELGIFTAIGTVTGMSHGGRFLAIFVGVLTGVGGGTIRDVFASEMPSIFVRHFYACASIIGAAVCVIIAPLNVNIAVFISAAVVFVLRILAAKYRWNLPK